MKIFIITRDGGEDGKDAIFYSPMIGRGRYYRHDFDFEFGRKQGLKLLAFKREVNAQRVCDHTNDLEKRMGYKGNLIWVVECFEGIDAENLIKEFRLGIK